MQGRGRQIARPIAWPQAHDAQPPACFARYQRRIDGHATHATPNGASCGNCRTIFIAGGHKNFRQICAVSRGSASRLKPFRQTIFCPMVPPTTLLAIWVVAASESAVKIRNVVIITDSVPADSRHASGNPKVARFAGRAVCARKSRRARCLLAVW